MIVNSRGSCPSRQSKKYSKLTVLADLDRSRLVNTASNCFGADLGRTQIVDDDGASNYCDACGADALAGNGMVWLHPRLKQRSIAEREHIVLHELAHLAQQRKSTSARGGFAVALDLELEAEAAAEAARCGRRYPIAPKAHAPGLQPFLAGDRPGRGGGGGAHRRWVLSDREETAGESREIR